MKNIFLKLTALAITASTLFVFTSCSNDNVDPEITTTNTAEPASVQVTDAPATEIPSKAETSAESEASTAPAEVSPADDDAVALQMYNDAANGIKNDRPKMHKKRSIQFRGLKKEMDGLSALVNKFIPKGEDETYEAGTDYTNIFPVIGESWSSKLSLDDLSDVTCTDNGDSWKIVLKLKDETIPTDVSDYSQTITGRAMAVNHTSEIRAGFGDAGTLTECTQDYYNCSITAVINKSTGKMQSCYHELNLTMYLGGNYGPITLSSDFVQPLLTITEDYQIYS